MIYLASPYSGTPEQMESRYRETVLWTVGAMRAGVPIFSPIVHWHEAAKLHALPTDAESWWSYNCQMMSDADSVIFLLLPGWETSNGMQMEHAFCEQNHKPYLQVHPNGLSPPADVLATHWKSIREALTGLGTNRSRARAVDRN